MNRRINYTVTEEYDGKSVKDFLVKMGFSHPVLVQLKKTERSIMRTGEWLYFHSKLSVGDVLDIYIEETSTSENIVPVSMPFDVIYEDEDLIVINKPVGMSIHPSMNHYDNSLANALMDYFQKEDSPFVFRCVNRLDKDTSGLTIIAKNPLSGAILYRQMTKREIKRTYYALVEGHPPTQGTINAKISRAPGSTILRMVDEEGGETACTHFKTLQYYKDSALVECVLETGRTHQIRVHMTHIGHPLLGDYIYNPSNQVFSHHALHAKNLEFLHPITKKELKLSAPFPLEFQNYIQKMSSTDEI